MDSVYNFTFECTDIFLNLIKLVTLVEISYKMFTDFSIDNILQTEKENLLKLSKTIYPTKYQHLSLNSDNEECKFKNNVEKQKTFCLFQETFLKCINGKQPLIGSNFKAPCSFDCSYDASSISYITGKIQ